MQRGQDIKCREDMIYNSSFNYFLFITNFYLIGLLVVLCIPSSLIVLTIVGLILGWVKPKI
jgi:hypothetical protein